MYNINHIKDFLGSDYRIVINCDQLFDKFSPIHEAEKSSLAWLSIENKNKLSSLLTTNAKNIIVSRRDEAITNEITDKNFIFVENPKLSYQRIVQSLKIKHQKPEIHTTSVIHTEAKIGKNVTIGPFTYIGKCTIGDNVKIDGHVYIYDNVKIGHDVIIQSGAVIGSEGFGMTRNENNEFENFPHIGGVIIGNNCEIGANTTIDRGALGNTVVNNGCKIDNLVHIAHNVVIGKHTAIAANSMVAGSTVIGDYCWIAPSTSLRDRVKVVNETTIGLGAVVTKNINEPDTYAGNPAKTIKKIIKINNFINEHCKE